MVDTSHHIRQNAIQQQQQQRPLSSAGPIRLGGGGLISHFCSPQPYTSLRFEFLGPELVDRGNVSAVAAAESCSSFLPICRGMARLSRPRASVCKFPVQRNYAVTQVPATGFEPWTIRLRIQHAINCATAPHCLKINDIQNTAISTYCCTIWII